MGYKYKPARLLPFDLQDISPFVVEQHPILFPESADYERYWLEQAEYIIDGKWGLDRNEEKGVGGYRWIPGNLYFYVNMTTIKDEGDEGEEIDIRPRLRDVEWYLFYALAACDGFSGFEGDDVFTCHRIVEKIERGGQLLNKEEIMLKKKAHNLYNSKGELKKYKEAREYLYEWRDKPLGKALYDNEALNMILLSSRGIGKEQPHSETIYTPDGQTTMGNVQVGDYVIGSNGLPTKVLDKFPQGEKDVYEIELSDGRKVRAGLKHLWKVFSRYENTNKNSNIWSVKTTEDILKNYKRLRIDSKHKAKYKELKYVEEYLYALPLSKAVEYEDKNLDIDPYFLGCWLGDGQNTRVSISTVDKEIKDYCYEIANKYNLKVTVNHNEYKSCPSYHLTKGNTGKSSYRPLLKKFKDLNLLNNKHIPEEYFVSSKEQRLELLRGLMDTDGTCSGNCVEFYSKNKTLAEDVCKLSRSLGIYTQIKEKDSFFKGNNYGVSYRVVLKTNLKIFNLDRKNKCHLDSQPISKSGKSRFEKVFIKNIVKLDYKEESSCIMVDNEDHTYLTTDYVVTHNSFSMGNGVIGYDFVTNGARTLEQFLEQSTSSTIVVGSEDSKKSTELLNKFSDAYEYLRTRVGAYYKDGFKENGAFWMAWEGSLSSGAKRAFTNEISLKGGKGTEGPGSKIVHVSYKSNPQAGVGYRARRMIVEEAGLLVKFFETHAENSATQKRKTKFGYTVYIGTGGNIEKIKEIREAFNNPRDYQVLPFKDIYNGTEKEIGLFVPAYYRNDIFRDAQGNMDYVAAFEDEMMEREKMKKSGSTAYEGYIISYPIAPQEMFLNNSGNVYPTDALEERLSELEQGAWKPNIGQLHYTDNTMSRVYWEEDVEGKYKIIKRVGDEKKMRDLKTGIVVYEPPNSNLPDPSYDKPMYIVFYDPVHKEGENVGSSLAVAFVFKLWDLGNPDKIQFNIVAEWVGRYPNMEDNHEQVLKLATFYNAKILPEFNGDFVRYCRMSNRFHLLQPRPGLAIDGVVKQKSANDVGVYISPGMISDLELYSLEVLNKPVDKKERIEGNLYIEEYIRMVHNIPSMRLTEELLFYDRDGNYDYVSAFLLLGLWIREVDITPVKRHDENKIKSKTKSIKKYFRASQLLQNNVGNNAFNY